MKQRILSILCVLCLVVAMLPPVTASAAAPTTLTVGGTNVLDGGGYWTTNADGTLTADMASADNYNVYYDGDGTLTLKDATINGTNTIGHVGAGIFASGDLTIVLEGSSTVTGVQDPNGDSQSIRVEGNLTIQGGGSLTAQGADTSNGSSYGIFVIGSFTQQGGSVTASGGNVSGNYNSTGLYVYGSTVTVQGGTLKATGGATSGSSYGISMSSSSSVTVGSAAVTATGGNGQYSYGLYVNSSSPSVTISGGGSLTARSGSATNRAGGIYYNPSGSGGSVTVGNGSTLLANSVILYVYDNSWTEKPLAPTGNGSWLIYGQSDQPSAVGGTYTLEENITIESGNTLTIPAGSTLTVPQGKTLTNNGTLNIANQSGLAGEGTLAGSGAFNLTNPDPVISGSDTLTYDGTDHFNDFSLTAPTDKEVVMGKEFAISSSPSLEGWSLDKLEIKNAGTYTLAASNGTTTIEKEITVSPAVISIASATVQGKTYDGNTTATVESVTFDGLVEDDSLSLGTDYTATAEFDSANAGSQTATVTVTLTDTVKNYTLASDGNTATATGTISPLPVMLNWETTSFTYDGSAKTVTAEVSNAVDGDTFTLTYEGNTGTAVGNYTAKVTGLSGEDADNYTLTGADNLSQSWSIGGASIAGATVELSGTAFTYNGQSQKPTVTVKLNGNTLNANTDYTVDFGGDSINAGTYTVTVTGTGNYSGTATSQPTYTITKADQAAMSITSSGPATFGQNYTLTTSGGSGSGTVTFTVTDGTGAATVSGNTLTPTKAGTVTVTAVKAGDNNYNDGTSVSVTITINKGTYDGTRTAAGSVLANWPGEVTLPAIPDGASYGEPSSNDVTGMSITGNVLSYTGGSGIVKDQTYTVTVPVTGATNYADYNITVTLTGTTRPSSGGGTTTPSGPSTGGSDGWTEIEEEVTETTSGTVTVNMNGTTEVPSEVFEAVAGKDVTLELDMGGGVKWEINGQDIPTDLDITDLDLGVSLNTSDIPMDVINMVTGEKSTVQLSLAHDGEFGFTMTLTAPVGTQNKGLWANLYHYDTTRKQMLFETAAQVDSSGNVALKFTHASEYAIVLDESSHELPFTDTAKGAWYQGAVEYVYRNSIMTGTSATSFEPNAPLSRAMVAQILYNLEGQPTVEGESTFADASGHWAVNAIAWAQQTGVVNGYEDNTFRPNRAASREELAQMLYNYAKVKGYDLTASGDLTAFPDGSKVSSWAEAAMAWANGNELINGHDDGTLQPGGDSTRAQAASILMSFDLNLAN
ncbi:MAG: S-layer homology domain-containing protein [Acutalibacter sp.]